MPGRARRPAPPRVWLGGHGGPPYRRGGLADTEARRTVRLWVDSDYGARNQPQVGRASVPAVRVPAHLSRRVRGIGVDLVNAGGKSVREINREIRGLVAGGCRDIRV